MDYDVGAFRGQAHGHGAADALGGAGDQRDATLQCNFHVRRKGSTGQPEMALPLGSRRGLTFAIRIRIAARTA